MGSAKRISAIVIAIGFFLYGVARLFGVGLLFLELFDVIHTAATDQAVTLLKDKLPAMNERALVPLGLTSYVTYSLVMGGVLIIGAIAVLFRKGWGAWLVIGYTVLFTVLFLNYQEFNAKVIHLGVGLFFALALFFLTASDRRSA